MATQPIVGLEVHAQLLTESKMFCGCSTKFGASPNTQVCPVCLAHPGVLPVPNRKAVEMVIRTGLALNCAIAPHSVFARKNYFYPDLAKNYQISQYELPLCVEGYVEIDTDSGPKRIRIRRVHLEEDTGKNLHTGAGESRIDFNRCGVPLMEIVSEPDLSSADECRAYLQKLQQILRYVEVCDGNMEEGSMRCEPTVNARDPETGKRTELAEIKNLASFRVVHQAVGYEIERHTRALEQGEPTSHETRRWLESESRTSVMRSKEEADDYRYFPEPDLMPLDVSEEQVEAVRREMPELPDAKRARFLSELGLSQYDATVMIQSREFAAYFERAVSALGGDAAKSAKAVANWMQSEVSRLLNETGTDIAAIRTPPEHLAALIALIDKGTISSKIAKDVFEEMFGSGKAPEAIVESKGLTQISDSSELEAAIDRILEANPDNVAAYKGGRTQLLGFFVGQVMKETRGRANPGLVNELLKTKLDQ